MDSDIPNDELTFVGDERQLTEVTVNDADDGGFTVIARISKPSFIYGVTEEQWREAARLALGDAITDALGHRIGARLQEILDA